jgi:hypothetical protein
LRRTPLLFKSQVAARPNETFFLLLFFLFFSQESKTKRSLRKQTTTSPQLHSRYTLEQRTAFSGFGPTGKYFSVSLSVYFYRYFFSSYFSFWFVLIFYFLFQYFGGVGVCGRGFDVLEGFSCKTLPTHCCSESILGMRFWLLWIWCLWN